jgi:hypothetical protein
MHIVMKMELVILVAPLVQTSAQDTSALELLVLLVQQA